MKQTISRWALAALALVMISASATAQNVSVQMTGTATSTTFIGVDGIRQAIQAVGNGGSVNVLTAGNYSSITLIGGKVYQVKGMVNGVNVVTSGATPAAITTTTAGNIPVNVRLVNLNLTATSGSSAVAFQINQISSATTTVALDKVVVAQQTVNLTLGRDAVKIQGASAANSGVVTLTALNSTFDCFTTGTGNTQSATANRDAINLAGGANALNGLTVSLTSCTLHAEGGQAIDWGTTQQDNMTWTIRNSTLRNDLNVGRATLFNADIAHNNCNVTIEDSHLISVARITDNNSKSGTNNIWRINRSTLDNRKFGFGTGSNQTVWRLRYNTNTATPFNQVILTNSIIAQQTGSGAFEHAGNTTSTIIHCLILREVASSNSGITQNNGALAANFKMYNSIMAGGNSATGTINFSGIPAANVARNIIAATPTQDDTDLGADRIVTTMAGLNLGNFTGDSGPITPFIPGAGSVAINAGLTTPSLNTAVGNVDRRKFSRTNTVPDIGPFETGFVPVELSTFSID